MIPIDAQIVEFALTNRLPLISPLRKFADIGGLISSWPSMHALWRHAANKSEADRDSKGGALLAKCTHIERHRSS